MNIQIKSNYNTILFHHVDSLSRWDGFVSEHHWECFQDQFEIDETVQNILVDYSKKRKSLGWDAESELLAWAYNGFQQKEEYSVLLESIKAIEKLADKQGRSVKDSIEEVSTIFEGKKIRLYEELSKCNDRAEEILKVYKKLFEVKVKKKIYCYLVHSPKKNYLQGGANGKSIYVELFPYENEDYSHTTNVIFHESFHKILEIRKKLEEEFVKRGHSDFLEKIPDLYPGLAHEYLDEVIVSTLSDVYLSDDDLDEKNDFHYETVLLGVRYFCGFLDYKDLTKTKPDVFFDQLTQKFETFLKERLYLKI